MVISIFKFVSRYYGICLDAGLMCSHTDIKRNFDFIEEYSNQSKDSKGNKISSSRIIYVKDSYGKIIPYVRPEVIHHTTKVCEYTICEKKMTKLVIDEEFLKKLTQLSTYQILELMHEYKCQRHFYEFLKNELIKRGFYEVKTYKIKKEVLNNELDKEDYFYDKYNRRRKIKCKKP